MTYATGFLVRLAGARDALSGAVEGSRFLPFAYESTARKAP